MLDRKRDEATQRDGHNNMQDIFLAPVPMHAAGQSDGTCPDRSGLAR